MPRGWAGDARWLTGGEAQESDKKILEVSIALRVHSTLLNIFWLTSKNHHKGSKLIFTIILFRMGIKFNSNL